MPKTAPHLLPPRCRHLLAVLPLCLALSACNSSGGASSAPEPACETPCSTATSDTTQTSDGGHRQPQQTSSGDDSASTPAADKPGADVPKTTQPDTRIRALWVWGSRTVLNHSARDELLAFAEQKRLNRLYLEASEALRYEPAALADFFRLGTQHGLEIELLFGQPDWALPENHHHVATIIDRVANFAARYPDIKVAGVHLDVEPYLLTEWDSERSTLISNFIDLLESARAQANRAGLSLQADIPVWFDEHGIFRNGRSRTLHELVIDATDGVGLMDYRDERQRIVNDASNELQYAHEQKKPVIVGVETLCIEPTWITFCEEGSQFMEEVLALVDGDLRHYSSYAGTAIHHYDSYRSLKR